MRIGPLPSISSKELSGLTDQIPTFKTGASDATGGAAGILSPKAASAVGGIQEGGFSNILENAVSEINGKMQTAQVEQSKVLTGESTNLHQAMIAMQESSTAFTLMVEVRNKLVESYQELMRMQV